MSPRFIIDPLANLSSEHRRSSNTVVSTLTTLTKWRPLCFYPRRRTILSREDVSLRLIRHLANGCLQIWHASGNLVLACKRFK